MSQPLRFFRSSIAVAALASITAFAADFPAKPVRLITPFPPGGSVDLVARLLGADLAKAWAQQVVVDNRAGASGNIGTELAKNAAPDGYALLVNTLPFVTNQFVYSTMPFDPLTDFAPISICVSRSMRCWSWHPSLPVQNVRELIGLARSRPGNLSYGTAGAATNPHIAAELLNYMGRTNMFAVHYKGGGAATTAAMSGETPICFSELRVADALPLVEAKRLRALGVTSPSARRSRRRSRRSPNPVCPAMNSRPGTFLRRPLQTPRPLINQINEKVRAQPAHARCRAALARARRRNHRQHAR